MLLELSIHIKPSSCAGRQGVNSSKVTAQPSCASSVYANVMHRFTGYTILSHLAA